MNYKNRGTQQELIQISRRSELGSVVVDKMSKSHSRVTKDISKIFSADSIDDSGEEPRCILIEGAPGIGKSVLAKEIAFRWARGELLKDFALVILVHLRDPQLFTMKSVTELLQLYTSSRVAVEVYHYLEE